jgi:precorrin-6A synthase
MRRLLVIGVGAGDPDHVTAQAVRALNEADVLFVVDKGPGNEDLVAVRREICARFIDDPAYNVVELPDPPRDRTSADYRGAVASWRGHRAQVWAQAVGAELGEHDVGAFLVWGDPSLYDSTLDVLERMLADGLATFTYEVIPGVSSIHALTARHRISLNRVGTAVQITTGRRLAADGWPPGVADVVVMLDAGCAFSGIHPDGIEIYWGAYLGTPGELLVAGPLAEAGPRIERLRARARAERGWIMDTYLLRRCVPGPGHAAGPRSRACE